MVFVERLIVMVSLEDRALQGFQQGTVMDVYIRIVDKYAGINIPVGVDV